MKKPSALSVVHWLFGLLFVALGIALCTKADFGLSMIAAPPYIIHLAMEKILPWWSQGVSEYIFEAVLLVVMCLIVRHFRLSYLLSFLTAVAAGFAIDGWLFVLGGPAEYGTIFGRIVAYILGDVICAVGVAFFFRTTLPLQVYELTVSEVADRYGLGTKKAKYLFDGSMLVLSLVIALAVGNFKGIGIGTVITTLINSPIIAASGSLIDKTEKRLFAKKSAKAD